MTYHGWILYTKEESIRNKNYIDFYRKSCDRRGMFIELVIVELLDGDERDLVVASQADAEKGAQYEGQVCMAQLLKSCRPDFVVNRTRDYRIAKWLEQQGIPVFNNSLVAELGNDKAKAYRFMEQQGRRILPVIYHVDEPPQDYPVVIKSCSGHGGTEVWMVRSLQEWQQWKRHEYRPDRQYIQQQPASEPGKDLRVYVVGNRIVAAVLRESDHDFRSNYSLGGRVSLYELSKEERQQAADVCAMFDIGMAGIDFLFHKGQLVFNELEDMVGARMLYALSDFDIVDAYVAYIKECLDDGTRCEGT